MPGAAGDTPLCLLQPPGPGGRQPSSREDAGRRPLLPSTTQLRPGCRSRPRSADEWPPPAGWPEPAGASYGARASVGRWEWAAALPPRVLAAPPSAAACSAGRRAPAAGRPGVSPRKRACCSRVLPGFISGWAGECLTAAGGTGAFTLHTAFL